MEEIEDNMNTWKDISCLWIGRINSFKMTILPKAMYRFNAILIKMLKALFTELEQILLKCVWKQKTLNCQNSLDKEEQSWRNHSSWLLAIIQSSSKQNSMVQTYRSMEQDICPRSKPMHSYGQLIYDKKSRIYNEKKTVSSLSNKL